MNKNRLNGWYNRRMDFINSRWSLRQMLRHYQLQQRRPAFLRTAAYFWNRRRSIQKINNFSVKSWPYCSRNLNQNSMNSEHLESLWMIRVVVFIKIFATNLHELFKKKTIYILIRLIHHQKWLCDFSQLRSLVLQCTTTNRANYIGRYRKFLRIIVDRNSWHLARRDEVTV